jgi:hypothetical protein
MKFPEVMRKYLPIGDRAMQRYGRCTRAVSFHLFGIHYYKWS